MSDGHLAVYGEPPCRGSRNRRSATANGMRCTALAGCFLLLMFSVGAQADGAKMNEALQARYDLQIPAGPGPHPAVVAVSGCSGFEIADVAYRNTLETLLDAGFATIRVDYVGASDYPRCRVAREVVITRDEVVAGIRQAVTHLRAHPRIKASAINLLGWSYGGGSVFHYLARNEPPATAVAAYYPSCHGVSMWEVETPVLVLFGGADSVAPPQRCRQMFSGKAAESIETEEYAGAYHAFDMIHLPAKMQYAFGTIGFEPTAAKAALARLLGFLRR